MAALLIQHITLDGQPITFTDSKQDYWSVKVKPADICILSGVKNSHANKKLIADDINFYLKARKDDESPKKSKGYRRRVESPKRL